MRSKKKITLFSSMAQAIATKEDEWSLLAPLTEELFAVPIHVSYGRRLGRKMIDIVQTNNHEFYAFPIRDIGDQNWGVLRYDALKNEWNQQAAYPQWLWRNPIIAIFNQHTQQFYLWNLQGLGFLLLDKNTNAWSSIDELVPNVFEE
eukprot:256389_1